MAVLTSKDEKDLIVTCKCGCGDSVHLVIDKSDEDLYSIMMFMNGSFASEQDKTFLNVFTEKVKKVWAIIRNKDFYYAEIMMNKDEFYEFKEYINNL